MRITCPFCSFETTATLVGHDDRWMWRLFWCWREITATMVGCDDSFCCWRSQRRRLGAAVVGLTTTKIWDLTSSQRPWWGSTMVGCDRYWQRRRLDATCYFVIVESQRRWLDAMVGCKRRSDVRYTYVVSKDLTQFRQKKKRFWCAHNSPPHSSFVLRFSRYFSASVKAATTRFV